MADSKNREDRVIAFLHHLKEHKGEREHLEHVLLKEIVEIAKREGYEFSSEDFKHAVRLQIEFDHELIRWPPTR